MFYDLYRSQLKNGDIISFSGKGRLSNFIKWAISSEFSHVGIVICNTELSPDGSPRYFIAESTTLNNTPAIDGEYRKGVQVCPLRQRIDASGDDVYWHRLRSPIEPNKNIDMLNWLFSHHAKKTPYDYSQAIASGIDPDKWGILWKVLSYPVGLIFHSKKSMRKLFCSELCVKALQIAGKADPYINPSKAHPEDVVGLPCLEDPILLKKS